MIQKRAVAALVLTGITSALLFTTPASANASTVSTPTNQAQATGTAVSLTDEQRNELRSFLNAYKVPAATQEALLTKLSTGEPWLSFTSGATPVSTETYTYLRDNVTIERYADGSVEVSTISDPYARGGAATSPWESSKAVASCSPKSIPGGREFRGCEAKVDKGVIMMSFNFTYQNAGGTQKITQYWNPGYRIIGGAIENQRMVRMSPKDVRTSADLSVAFRGFPAGWTAYMGVRISGSDASTYNN